MEEGLDDELVEENRLVGVELCGRDKLLIGCTVYIGALTAQRRTVACCSHS